MDQSNEEKTQAASKGTAEKKSHHRRQSSTITDEDIDTMSQASNSPPLPPASATLTPNSHPQSPSLYISPASSSGKSPMLTIDTVPRRRSSQKTSSDFFIPYDSDASGGSFVHDKSSKSDLASTTSSGYGSAGSSSRPKQHKQHNRFASFDSNASSGSVRFISPRSQPKPTVNPHLLPYHERKKLQKLQQQQQQQQQPPNQQQQQQQQHQQNPKQPTNQQRVPQQGPFPPNMMMMMPPPPPIPGQLQMDPQAAAAAFYGMYGYPPPGAPGFPPPPPIQHQHQQHHQLHSPQQQHPPQHAGFPPGFMMPPPPPISAGGQQQQQRGGPPPFLQPYPMPFYPPPNLPQVFPQHQHPPHPPQPQQQRRSSQTSISSRDRISTASLPKSRPHHVRTDSHGSMSSLGSTGGGSDSEHQQHQQQRGSSPSSHHRNSTSSNNSGLASAAAGIVAKNHNNPAPISPYRSSSSKPRLFVPGVDSPSRSRLSSQDSRPPASRGTHKRLASINNDEWGTNEKDDNNNGVAPNADAAAASSEDLGTIDGGGGGKYGTTSMMVDENSSYSGYSSSSDTNSEDDVNEKTSLLPPSGISTNEQEATNNLRKDSRTSGGKYYGRRSSETDAKNKSSSKRNSGSDVALDRHKKSVRKSRRKMKKSRRRAAAAAAGNEDDSDTSDSSYDYRRWTMKRARMLEKEREQVHQQWKAEYLAKTEREREQKEYQRLHRRCFRWFASFGSKGYRFITNINMFIANLPAAIGAVAMAFATLGIVWFKFTEENLQTCERVHFHSSQCTFPEFPGCFYCDTTVPMYKVAVNFHFGCNVVAGTLALMFVAKVVVATRAVIDEMASPVTASPAGLLCMTTVCVFAGRGLIGQVMVSLAATVHLGLVIWYIYIALAYQIMPEPTWFPNTIGIGLTAVKTWLYYPMPGHLLMAISLSLNIFFFPISLIRVAINEKISATVGWMQMSAPALSLYALTIMAQPSFEEENPDVTNFQRVHRMIYLPCMHFMCALSLIGFFASCHSLWSRWDDLKKRPFSPAHSAFCFPTLSHANAIQSYRGAVLTFSEVKPHDWRLIILYAYWFVVLLGGTVATLWISSKFLYNLPAWTNMDLADEEEPPAPSETILSLQEMITAGETMRQPFVSPAVLQANETGALVLTRTGPEGELRYVRTRRLLALGFEPTMRWSEMQKEREVLLEWVGKNPPRRRNRTLSVPGIDFSYGSSSSSAFGTDNRGIYGGYGSFSPLPPARHSRADTGW